MAAAAVRPVPMVLRHRRLQYAKHNRSGPIAQAMFAVNMPVCEARLCQGAVYPVLNRGAGVRGGDVQYEGIVIRAGEGDTVGATQGIDHPRGDQRRRAGRRVGPEEAEGSRCHRHTPSTRWVLILCLLARTAQRRRWQVTDTVSQQTDKAGLMGLADLGFSSEQEFLYRGLLQDPTSTPSELAQRHGLSLLAVHEALDGLVTLGVLKPERSEASGFIVCEPTVAIGQLIERREDDLLRQYRRASQSRYLIEELKSLYRQPEAQVPENEAVERLEDMQAIRDRLEELSFYTRTSVYSIQPGGPQSRESLEASRPLDQRGIRRGLEMRVIHEASVLDDELNRVYLRELVMGGAKVRVTSQHVDRMIIMDSKVAVVPVDPADSRRGALIVRHPGLLSGFLDLFNRAWQDATDLPWHTEQSEQVPAIEISKDDRRVLELLASGCTDETSAREVGVSVRHLRRTISRLMQQLGANSRFEAGVEAARRGWL
jgi:sugar-specific transcriptional regulator TrmB/DNA-binding CsgD family transcriptional regulator